MASLIGVGIGALVNAFAFSGTSYLFHKLSSPELERKRHDLALEKFQKDHEKWIRDRQEAIDEERKREKAAGRAEKDFQELDEAMREYFRASEPKFEHYYVPSPKQQNNNLLFTVGSTVVAGVAGYFVAKHLK